jgi:hypothetical protein
MDAPSIDASDAWGYRRVFVLLPADAALGRVRVPVLPVLSNPMSEQKPLSAGSHNFQFLQPQELGSQPSEPSTWSGARAYMLSFFAAMLLCAVGFSTMLAVLSAARRLPAPPVSGTYCIDEKLAWLKHNPDALASNVIAVGSSVTWRNLDFSVLSPAARSAVGGVVNAAPCFLRANQIRFMVHHLLQRRPEIHTVLTVLNPRDMEVCSTTPSAFYEPTLADAYLNGSVPDFWVYFRNLRAESFIRDIVQLPVRRQQELVYDRFGSGPITRNNPQLWYPFNPELSCYRELHSLATELSAKGVQFIVATLPVMPDWTKHHDPEAQTQRGFLADIETALSGTGAFLVDGQTKHPLPTPAFTDPAHLQWPVVADFTRFIWDEARRAGAKLPPRDLSTSG